LGGYHDEGAVFVGLLAQGVQFGDGIVEGLFGEVACSVGGVQDLVIEDREVEGEAEADLLLAPNERTKSQMKIANKCRQHHGGM
jgi:hypothetical protein